MNEEMAALIEAIRATAESREKAMDSLTAYFRDSWHSGQDNQESEFSAAHHAPADDPDLPTARKIYLLETYRSLAESRAAFAALALHARRDSRTLSELLARLAAPSPLLTPEHD